MGALPAPPQIGGFNEARQTMLPQIRKVKPVVGKRMQNAQAVMIATHKVSRGQIDAETGDISQDHLYLPGELTSRRGTIQQSQSRWTEKALSAMTQPRSQPCSPSPCSSSTYPHFPRVRSVAA